MKGEKEGRFGVALQMHLSLCPPRHPWQQQQPLSAALTQWQWGGGRREEGWKDRCLHLVPLILVAV